jgi:hypothetical protein
VASATQIAFTPDRDFVLTQLSAAATNAVLSNEPDLTIALLAAPTKTGIVEGFRINVGGASGSIVQWTGLAIPFPAHQTVYVAFSPIIGTVLLQLDELTIG